MTRYNSTGIVTTRVPGDTVSYTVVYINQEDVLSNAEI